MSKMRIWLMLVCCFVVLAAAARGQSKQKPGLWEMTSQASMGGASMPQMPQLPPGAQLPPGMQMPQMGSSLPSHTMQACVTQAMIDKYGTPYSSPPRGDCKLTDVAITPTGMTAKMVCSGQMNATGTIQATFVDANTTKTKMHLTGTMQAGPNSMPLDMTVQTTSTYKGPDCGSLKPLPMPSN